MLACAQCPHPIDPVPLLLVSTRLTSLRRLCGLVCRAPEPFIQTLRRLFLGEATGLPSFSSMQQCGTPACCVVLSNAGVLTMNITVIVHTRTPLADAFELYGIPYQLTS